MKDLSSDAVVISLLTHNASRLSQQAKATANSGNIRVIDNFHYVRKQVDVGGTIQLVDTETKATLGVSTISENKLSFDKVAIIDRIKLGYDINANPNMEGAVKYDKALPAAFRNAFLRIRQGDYKFADLPLSELANRYTGNSIKDDYLFLKNPLVLVGGTEFFFELVFPKGAAKTGTDLDYIEVMFGGVDVIRNNK